MSSAGVYATLIVAAPTSTTKTAFTSSSSGAVAIGTGVRKVYMYATQLCHVKFGTSSSVGNATTSDLPVAAGLPYVFDLKGGVTHFKVIRNASDGDLFHADVTG